MRWCFLCLLLLAAMLSSDGAAGAQSIAEERLDFGTAGLPIPPAVRVKEVSPQVVERLGRLMLRERGALRMRMISDLGDCGRPEAIRYLEQVFEDSDADVRAEAARAVGRIGEGGVAPRLQPLLADANAVVRSSAVDAAVRLGDGSALVVGLQDDDEGVVAAALAAAGTAADASVIAGQIEQLPPPLRCAALRRLGEIGSREQVAAVARFLSGNIAERVAAAEALAELKATDQAQQIAALLDDPHPSVRRAAMRALAALGAAGREVQALRLLNDADATVRQSAAETLVSAPNSEAVTLLSEQLDDGYPPLRYAAREALVAIGDAAVPTAAQLLRDADHNRRIDGSFILGALRSSAALAEHVELLKDDNWMAVAQAAQSLGRIGRTEAAGPIGALVQRIMPLMQSLPPEQLSQFAAAATEAIIAAARLQHRPSLQVMRELIPQRGNWPQLRAACAWGFGVLGESSDEMTCEALMAIPGDLLEVQAPKIEAIKALGHVRYAPAAAMLRSLADSSADPNLRWMAHWAHHRITGEESPYTPPQHRWMPDLAVSELLP